MRKAEPPRMEITVLGEYSLAKSTRQDVKQDKLITDQALTIYSLIQSCSCYISP